MFCVFLTFEKHFLLIAWKVLYNIINIIIDKVEARKQDAMGVLMGGGGEGWSDVTHQVDAVHDADAEGHEGLWEVNDLFTLCCDGEACNRQVSFL